jgi:beta-lactamase class A
VSAGVGDLQQQLEGIATRLNGTLGLAVSVLVTGDRYAVNADALFPMASVFKVPLLVHLFRLADAGHLRLAERVTLRAEDQTQGSGVLKELLPGARLALADLAMLMTIVSDNTATDLLYGRVGGGDAITAAMARLGLHHIAVRMDCRTLLNVATGLPPADYQPETVAALRERLLQAQFDYRGPAFAATLENSCATPADMVRLFTLIERREAAAPASCEQMLAMLLRQQLNERIPLLLPRPFKVAHKTGTLGTTRNDAGLIYLPNGDPIVFCAFAKDVPTRQWEQGDRCIAEAALAVYTAYA